MLPSLFPFLVGLRTYQHPSTYEFMPTGALWFNPDILGDDFARSFVVQRPIPDINQIDSQGIKKNSNEQPSANSSKWVWQCLQESQNSRCCSKSTEPTAPVMRCSNWMLFVRYQQPIKKLISTERKEENIVWSFIRINPTNKPLKKEGSAIQ